jgi:hypothetical protein
MSSRPDRPVPPLVLGPQFHPCRLGPVVRHVGAYLAGEDAPEAEQRHAAAHAFRNAQVDFEQFTRSVCTGTDLVAMELTIRGGGRALRSVSTYLPSPLTLLLLCTRNCEPGISSACASRPRDAARPPVRRGGRSGCPKPSGSPARRPLPRRIARATAEFRASRRSYLT